MTETNVQQLLNVWMGLDIKRQITVVAATVAMFLAILAMSRIVTAPTMTLLYSGLENGAAGEVVRSLEQRGVPFEVRGGSIFVDAQNRDQLRLTLASEGLPANSSRGYELLDSLSGFGTTSQMFDAAYWRAKEGELARTIVSSPSVAMARVHIASTGSNPFQRSVTPTASVAITPNAGQITGQQAKAIRFLIASAVAGLSADDVAVIDVNGALIGAGDDAAPAAGSEDKENMLRERVERLLEARVGAGNAVVEVSVETVTETEEIRERRFDPQERVVISTDTEERSSTSNEAGGGDVTVASNLPDGDAAGSDSASSQNSETRERINYEVSETERAIVKAAGAIRRVTVAVLVNETLADVEGRAETAQRSAEELSALRELVASAVGFDEARGDVITIKSMELQSVVPQGTVAETSVFDNFHIDVMSAIQMAILAIVTLILGLFVVRPVLTRDAPSAPEGLPAPLSEELVNRPAIAGSMDGSPGNDIGIDHGRENLPDLSSLDQAEASETIEYLAADPVDRLRSMIGERQEETVEILRSWLEEERA
ncbi:flagellar M-ring protein [Tateyamaria omphalii]|uniref:flagellar basal-body MS-ring/collar protein FliF n=1 Tax=Tateyamaria omphalii TaxID=299262 RepID=UPI0019A1D945|nr:flagellar basal-body MS-ring/collar protein FliF [Tateyamaria omphalii]GGX38310.1 flagellar M-ring protein [Tateyamaria omphalii]